jgi:hypothetical protein
MTSIRKIRCKLKERNRYEIDRLARYAPLVLALEEFELCVAETRKQLARDQMMRQHFSGMFI